MNSDTRPPQLGQPPTSYDRAFYEKIMAELRSTFSTLTSPGPVRASSLSLSQIPTSNSGLRDGDTWADSSFVRIYSGAAQDTLSETIADTVGAMFSGNTETGIAVTYQDADNTIDLALDDEYLQDLVGAMVSGNTETSGLAVTYDDTNGKLDFVVTIATLLGGLLTTRGDLATRDASTVIRLAVGAADTFLGSNGTDPAWKTAAQVLTSLGFGVGNYTPTLTTVTNLDSGTANACQYVKISNMCFVFGIVGWDATAAASTLTTGGMSLPIASAVTSSTRFGGVAAAADLNSVIRINGDATNDRANFQWASQSTSNLNFAFIFGYQIQ